MRISCDSTRSASTGQHSRTCSTKKAPWKRLTVPSRTPLLRSTPDACAPETAPSSNRQQAKRTSPTQHGGESSTRSSTCSVPSDHDSTSPSGKERFTSVLMMDDDSITASTTTPSLNGWTKHEHKPSQSSPSFVPKRTSNHRKAHTTVHHAGKSPLGKNKRDAQF